MSHEVINHTIAQEFGKILFKRRIVLEIVYELWTSNINDSIWSSELKRSFCLLIHIVSNPIVIFQYSFNYLKIFFFFQFLKRKSKKLRHF